MMISISAPSYDPNGFVVLHNAVIENGYQGERRGSVTATLDGGSYAYDTGYSISDQTINATYNHPSRELLETLRYLVAYYATIILSIDSGCYTAKLSFTQSADRMIMNFRLLSQVSA